MDPFLRRLNKRVPCDNTAARPCSSWQTGNMPVKTRIRPSRLNENKSSKDIEGEYTRGGHGIDYFVIINNNDLPFLIRSI